jgi:hypothetical protein
MKYNKKNNPFPCSFSSSLPIVSTNIKNVPKISLFLINCWPSFAVPPFFQTSPFPFYFTREDGNGMVATAFHHTHTST